jgi:hypothetical protein
MGMYNITVMRYDTTHISEKRTIIITYPNGGNWYSLHLQHLVTICNVHSAFAMFSHHLQHSVTTCNIQSQFATFSHDLQRSVTIYTYVSLKHGIWKC